MIRSAAGGQDRGGPPEAVDEGVTMSVAVQMELTRIIINENNEQQIIFLKEVDGERTFPIVIGIFEATSIDRRVKGLPAPRPLTHDLLANTIELLGGELRTSIISELRDHTYYAKLRIRHSGELVEVDSRPSDAIAVAVTVDVPIFVAERHHRRGRPVGGSAVPRTRSREGCQSGRLGRS